MQTFAAKMDKNTKLITILVIGLTSAAIIPILFIDDLGGLMKTFIAGSIVVSLYIGFLFRPKSYTIASDALIIKRGLGQVSIALHEIIEAREVTKADLGFGIRTFGVGGFFGYYGKYNYKKIGAVTAYITNPDKTVLIRTQSNKRYLISPDDTLGFLQFLNKAASLSPTSNSY